MLTLCFDDAEEPGEGGRLITPSQAKQIVRFIQDHMDVDTLLIHCYAGVSRSRAVGVFARYMFGLPPVWEISYNEYVCSLQRVVYERIKNNG